MNIEIGIFNILILFGAFQGFILAVILTTTKRLRKASNSFLALLLFALALLNFVSAFEMVPAEDRSLFLSYQPFLFFWLIPPAVYFFVKYLINPTYQWQRRDHLFFVPFLIELCIRGYKFSLYLTANYFTPEEAKSFNIINNGFETLAVIAVISVIVHGIISLRRYEENLYENYAEVESHSLSWLRNLFFAGLVLCAVWFVVALSDFSAATFQFNLAIISLLGLSALIYYCGYSMIIRQDLLDSPIFAISNEAEQESPSSELSSKADDYYDQIKNLMTQERIFTDPNLNMSLLSEKTGLSNSYLSQIINQKEGRNFFDFVNSYRVEEVVSMMKDSKYDHYTLLALSQDAGFKSKSTFNAVFKKVTGETPSVYRRNLIQK